MDVLGIIEKNLNYFGIGFSIVRFEKNFIPDFGTMKNFDLQINCLFYT